MGWLTEQKHKTLKGENLEIAVKFNHGCVRENPSHRIGACTKEISLPVAHMSTPKEFNDVFLLAFCKGQTFAST